MEMKRDLIAAVDAGTTGTRCCIFDRNGKIVSSGYYPMKTLYPGPGLVEQDPNLVIDLTMKAVNDAVVSVDPHRIIGLCITVQRNSFVPVDKNGNFLSNMITWQDQRGEEAHPWMLDRLKANGLNLQDLYRINGQPFGSFQCGFKALWFRHFREDLYKRTYKLLTPQAYITHAFGAEGYKEENNNQSFWLVANADEQKIDEGLCRIFDLRPDIFPDAFSPGTLAGTVSEEAAKRCGLIAGTPIYIGSGDQNCGALGAGNYGTPDIVSVCMGTAGLCIAYSEKPIRHPKGMCQIQGHPAGGYLMETHSSSCMSSYQWAESMFYTAEQSGEHALAEEAKKSPVGSRGVLFLPWLQGAACPHYDDSARGAYIGMSLVNNKSDISRATMEGICFENLMMLKTLWEADLPLAKSLRVVGGASNNDFWNQMQADIYGLPVETIEAKESTALGAAIICAVSAGMYDSYKEASKNMTHVLKEYIPNDKNKQKYNEIYAMWDECYQGLSQGAFKMIHNYQSQLRTNSNQ